MMQVVFGRLRNGNNAVAVAACVAELPAVNPAVPPMIHLRKGFETHIVDGHQRVDTSHFGRGGYLVAQAVKYLHAVFLQLVAHPQRAPQCSAQQPVGGYHLEPLVGQYRIRLRPVFDFGCVEDVFVLGKGVS